VFVAFDGPRFPGEFDGSLACTNEGSSISFGLPSELIGERAGIVSPCTMCPGDGAAQGAPSAPFVRQDAFVHPRRSIIADAAVLLLAVVGPVACDARPVTTSTPEPAATQLSNPTTTPSPAPSVQTSSPSASQGPFPFPADAIVGYYETQGYACTPAQPSSQAVGYAYRTCQWVDPDGRTRVVGVVTDAQGAVADGFASIQGTDAESFLDPVVALEPLAGFLGAMLGETQGEALLPWLAGHLGDDYATTTIGEVTVATYIESTDDHSKLYVEVANQGYLDAPRPSAPP
jgi:hypothetical protein